MTQNELGHELHLLPTTQAELLASERILQQQATALFQLTQSKAISKGQLSQAFQEVTEVAANVLQVERASIWLSDEQGTKIQCADLFQQTEQIHASGSELKAVDYPAYWNL